MSRFKRVALFCPPALTGGPEAMHQLAAALNAAGVRADIVYSSPEHSVGVRGETLICDNPVCLASMQAYARYKPAVSAEIPLRETTLVVLPEPWADLHTTFPGCGVAIWWLSIDNAFPRHPQIADPATRKQALGGDRLIHFHQSAYARGWLQDSGFTQVFELGDYISEEFTAAEAQAPSPRPLAAFNPEKGGDAAEAFFSDHPQFEALALRGFTKPQLREIFAERLIYLDFGGFPGKDRMPREAAMAGAVVFVHRAGAAANGEDFRLPDAFRFTRADADSGALHAHLQEVVRDPQGHWLQQADFRAQIRGEKAQFLENVRSLWAAASR